jgi:hypothetical protein
MHSYARIDLSWRNLYFDPLGCLDDVIVIACLLIKDASCNCLSNDTMHDAMWRHWDTQVMRCICCKVTMTPFENEEFLLVGFLICCRAWADMSVCKFPTRRNSSFSRFFHPSTFLHDCHKGYMPLTIVSCYTSFDSSDDVLQHCQRHVSCQMTTWPTFCTLEKIIQVTQLENEEFLLVGFLICCRSIAWLTLCKFPTRRNSLFSR